jgi:hypothetical protein
MTYRVICPPCGHVHQGETEDELVRNAQEHGLSKHGKMPPREAILGAIEHRPDASNTKEAR